MELCMLIPVYFIFKKIIWDNFSVDIYQALCPSHDFTEVETPVSEQSRAVGPACFIYVNGPNLTLQNRLYSRFDWFLFFAPVRHLLLFLLVGPLFLSTDQTVPIFLRFYLWPTFQ